MRTEPRILLGLTWALTAITLPWPLIELMHKVVRHSLTFPKPRPDSVIGVILAIIGGTMALYWFLLWASGKIVAAILGFLLVLVSINHSIPPRIKLLTVAIGFIACGLLFWWIGVVRYQW